MTAAQPSAILFTMYRTTIEALEEGLRVSREHSADPEVSPYRLSDTEDFHADFPSEHVFRILSAGNLMPTLTPQGEVEFRQENPNAELASDLR